MYFYKDSNQNIYESSTKICNSVKYKLKKYNTNKYYIVDNLVEIENPKNKCLTFYPDQVLTSSAEQFISTKYLAATNFINSYNIGVNITGFDNQVFKAGDAYAIDKRETILTDAVYKLNKLYYMINLIDPSFIQYILDTSLQVVRLPVMPFYLFKNYALEQTYNTDVFTPILNGKYNNTCEYDQGPQCSQKEGYQDNCPNYLYAIKQLISHKIYCIIDIHSDQYNLCSISNSKNKNEPMSPSKFINMWKYIVQYILETIEPKYHQYILFELCNEPFGTNGDICKPINGCTQDAGDLKQSKCQQIYDLSYQIPTINAIRELEKHYNSPPHIIIVTTYNNWSGVHFWIKNGLNSSDGTLEQLVKDLSDNKLSKSVENNIIIAGHQYCDADWSGGGTGCAETFKPELIANWLKQVDNILKPHDLKWFQTEGNVKNPLSDQWYNYDYYNNWLKNISSNTTTNIGYTLWFMNKDVEARTHVASQINDDNNYKNYYKDIYNTDKKTFKYTDEITFPVYNFNKLLR
jgi:hypothetical protein